MVSIPKKNFATICVIICLFFFLTSAASAQTDVTPSSSHKWFRSFGISTGFGSASLDKKDDDYEVVPLLFQFSLDLNPLAEKLHIKSNITDLELLIEPFANFIARPSANVEIGCSFPFRYSVKIAPWMAPYVEIGLGFIYTTQHVHEQDTQYNFTTQLGIGTKFFLSDYYSLTAGYRFRHMSNAGLASPNRGVDSHFGLIGLTYIFD
jgi:opacity protein-like surface antigen